MAELFASGRAIDLILAGIALEALALYALERSRRARGLQTADWLPSLASGALLMLALRFAIAGAPWPLLSLLLLCSGGMHAADLWFRHRTRLRVQATAGSTGSA